MALGKMCDDALKDADGIKASDTKAPLTEIKELVTELKGKHKLLEKWKTESSALYVEMTKAEVAIAAAIKQVDTRKKAASKKIPAPAAAFLDQLDKVIADGNKYQTKLKERIKLQKEVTDTLNQLGNTTKASD